MMIRHAPDGHDQLRRALFAELAERTFNTVGEMGGRFNRDVWYAEIDGEVVGTAMIGPPRDIMGPWVGELHRLEVHPDHRRRGIGTRLHDECLATWRARGITVAVLELRTDDEALDFYESHGWHPDGHTRQGHNATYHRLLRTIT